MVGFNEAQRIIVLLVGTKNAQPFFFNRKDRK
jgi:hypothetical protein